MKSSHDLNPDHSSNKENIIECLKKYDLYSDTNLNFIKLNSREPEYHYHHFSEAIDTLKSRQALNKENFEMIFKFPKDARCIACSLTTLSNAKITIDDDMRSLLKTIPDKSQAFAVICAYLKKERMFNDETMHQAYNKVVNMPANEADSFSGKVSYTKDLELRKKMLQNFLGYEEKKESFSFMQVLKNTIWRENSNNININTKMDEFKQRVFTINPEIQHSNLNELNSNELDIIQRLQGSSKTGEELLNTYAQVMSNLRNPNSMISKSAPMFLPLFQNMYDHLPQLLDSLVHKGFVTEVSPKRCTLG